MVGLFQQSYKQEKEQKSQTGQHHFFSITGAASLIKHTLQSYFGTSVPKCTKVIPIFKMSFLLWVPLWLQVCFRCREVYCSDRSAAWQHRADMACGTFDARQCLLYGRPGVGDYRQQSRQQFFPDVPGGLSALNPTHGYSGISIPGGLLHLFVCYLFTYRRLMF